MKLSAIIILIITLFGFSRYANIKSILVHSKEYEVIDEINMNLSTKKRTGKMFSIISDAQAVDELLRQEC